MPNQQFDPRGALASAMLGAIMGDRKPDVTPVSESNLAEAQKFVSAYIQGYTFKPGDVITWKPGMRNCRTPEYGEPVVVAEVFPAQRPSVAEGSPYDMEPCDMRVVSLKDEDGEWVMHPGDSRRFMPYEDYPGNRRE